MKPVSTGTGLIVLSATIAACFAVSHLGGEERALAQGIQASRAITELGSGVSSQRLTGPTGNCAPPESAWFSPTPRQLSYDCGQIGRQPYYSADVNGDGTTDYFVAYTDNYGLVIEGQPTPTPIGWLFRSETSGVGESTFHTHTNIFPRSSAIGEGLKSLFPNIRNASFTMNEGSDPWQRLGWRDCDGDGDLDLVVNLSLTFYGGSGDNSVRPFWFENTGFQMAPPANRYDHDGDGHVNTADLSLLLMEFTD